MKNVSNAKENKKKLAISQLNSKFYYF